MRTGKRNRYRQPDSPDPNRKSKKTRCQKISKPEILSRKKVQPSARPPAEPCRTFKQLIPEVSQPVRCNAYLEFPPGRRRAPLNGQFAGSSRRRLPR
ncbi:hypothetical protein EVAR_3468_1 [Eumeta japonica]|uniref:Uncharacterized protein n=1 Tax=Eumeta variegata TaxID=151549 RepID=A0A4C1STB5_EUMVA|nr:hypothetical protein EVAR_3468_1 [Eumeta japonica]